MLVIVTDVLPVRPGVAIPYRELSWRFSRAGGPGGQSVNTADSRVELRWDLESSHALAPALKQRALQRLGPRLVDGAVVIVAAEHRAQLLNRKAALARLVALISEAIAPPPALRRPTRPSRAAVRARLAAKRHRSEVKRGRRSTGD